MKFSIGNIIHHPPSTVLGLVGFAISAILNRHGMTEIAVAVGLASVRALFYGKREEPKKGGEGEQ